MSHGSDPDWEEALRSCSVDDPQPLTRMVRSVSVPVGMRGVLWRQLLDKHAKRPVSYSPITTEAFEALVAAESQYDRYIDVDLPRTIPNEEFQQRLGDHGRKRLQRVLHAYAVLRPEIGYCQGMNYLAAILTFFLERDEDAFAAFVDILEHEPFQLKFAFAHVVETLAGSRATSQLNRYLDAFGVAVAQALPELHAHFVKHDITPHFFAAEWFITMYAYTLSFEMSVRVWDRFLLEGRALLFRFGLGLLASMQETILNSEDFETIIMHIKRDGLERLSSAAIRDILATQEIPDFVGEHLPTHFENLEEQKDPQPPPLTPLTGAIVVHQPQSRRWLTTMCRIV